MRYFFSIPLVVPSDLKVKLISEDFAVRQLLMQDNQTDNQKENIVYFFKKSGLLFSRAAFHVQLAFLRPLFHHKAY